MNTQLIHETSSRTLAGTIIFPDVVANLLHAGVEYYHVAYTGPVWQRLICARRLAVGLRC